MTNAELIEELTFGHKVFTDFSEYPTLTNAMKLAISRLKTASKMAEALNDMGLVFSVVIEEAQIKHEYKCIKQAQEALDEWNHESD